MQRLHWPYRYVSAASRWQRWPVSLTRVASRCRSLMAVARETKETLGERWMVHRLPSELLSARKLCGHCGGFVGWAAKTEQGGFSFKLFGKIGKKCDTHQLNLKSVHHPSIDVTYSVTAPQDKKHFVTGDQKNSKTHFCAPPAKKNKEFQNRSCV